MTALKAEPKILSCPLFASSSEGNKALLLPDRTWASLKFSSVYFSDHSYFMSPLDATRHLCPVVLSSATLN